MFATLYMEKRYSCQGYLSLDKTAASADLETAPEEKKKRESEKDHNHPCQMMNN